MAISSVDDIPTKYADYDPHQAAYQDDAGTTPATSGDAVGNVPDAFGLADAVKQSTTVDKPQLATDANGWLYLDFDGVSQYLSNGTFQPPSSGAQPFELTIVAQAKGTATTNPLVGDGNVYSYRQRTTSDYQLNFGTNLRRGTPDTSLHVHQVVVNGASSEIYIDGTLQGTAGDAGSGAWAAGIYLCTINSLAQFGYQKMYRVLLHDVLSSGDRSDLYGVLNTLYSSAPPSGGGFVDNTTPVLRNVMGCF